MKKIIGTIIFIFIIMATNMSPTKADPPVYKPNSNGVFAPYQPYTVPVKPIEPIKPVHTPIVIKPVTLVQPKDNDGCISDFNCKYGEACVKPYYSSKGKCVKKVNSFGTPTYSPPTTDSIFINTPNANSCYSTFQCPFGFTCDINSGVCKK